MTTAEYLRIALARQYPPLPDMIETLKQHARQMGGGDGAKRWLRLRIQEARRLKGFHSC